MARAPLPERLTSRVVRGRAVATKKDADALDEDAERVRAFFAAS